MTACTVADRCRHVVSGGECVACGGRTKGGTGIAGAASYSLTGNKPLPVCAVCGGPLDGQGAKPRAWVKRGYGVVQGCGRTPECRNEPPTDMPAALAVALADGLIPDAAPDGSDLETRMHAWVRREMAMHIAGVGIKHRERYNP